MKIVSVKSLSALLLVAFSAVNLSACDMEMPTIANTGVEVPNYNSYKALRLPANKISKSKSVALAKKQGQRFDVMPEMVLGVMTQESGFNANAVSYVGAQGLMQIMPTTLTHIKAKSGLKVSDPFDPVQNSAAGTWYLRSLYDELEGVSTSNRWRFALASYNGGIGRVQNAIKKAQQLSKKSRAEVTWTDIKNYLPRETRNYVPAVVGHTAYYRTQSL